MEYTKLNNGIEMPMLGFGVYQIAPENTETAVTQAINAGYRLIDTAQGYRNEVQVGAAVKKSGIPRQDFFLVTKIWITNAGYEKAKASIDRSLGRLQTDYIDLMLIHQPFGDNYGTYRAMEDAYKEGKLRAIGLSNFFTDRYLDISNFMEIKPAVDQMEVHVFDQQTELRGAAEKYNTKLMAWSCLAQGRNGLFTDPILTRIGKKYGKTPAQVNLRFLTQSGIIAIPRSTNAQRVKENIDIFDFSLSTNDIKEIKNMDLDKSQFVVHQSREFVESMLNGANQLMASGMEL